MPATRPGCGRPSLAPCERCSSGTWLRPSDQCAQRSCCCTQKSARRTTPKTRPFHGGCVRCARWQRSLCFAVAAVMLSAVGATAQPAVHEVREGDVQLVFALWLD